MRLPYWLVEAHRKLDAPVVAASVAPTMTLDRMTQDGIELTEYLCKHLGKRKVILVAHSFGTILGLRMIREKPDLFFAYVGTGQVADETQNYAMAYEALLKKARAAGNQQAFDELKSIGPPPTAQQFTGLPGWVTAGATRPVLSSIGDVTCDTVVFPVREYVRLKQYLSSDCLRVSSPRCPRVCGSCSS